MNKREMAKRSIQMKALVRAVRDMLIDETGTDHSVMILLCREGTKEVLLGETCENEAVRSAMMQAVLCAHANDLLEARRTQ